MLIMSVKISGLSLMDLAVPQIIETEMFMSVNINTCRMLKRSSPPYLLKKIFRNELSLYLENII